MNIRITKYVDLRILFLIIIVLLSNHLKAQINISGKIENNLGEPIEYATIQLLFDSVYNQSALSDSLGKYKINASKKGNCELLVNMLGYLPTHKKINLKKDTIVNFILKVDTNILNTVTIIGNKSLIKSEPDRLIVNIKGNIETTGKETTQILKQLPSINLSNNSLNMFGKSSVVVYINDRIVRLSGQSLLSYLNSLPPDIINNIEIISSPPAKYDAEGNTGIIKINTNKNIQPGWKEYFTTAYIKNTFSSGILSAYINYTGKKMFFEGTVSGGKYSYLNQTNYYSYFPDETVTTFNPKRWNYYGAKTKLTVGYDFNENNSLIIDAQIPFYNERNISDIENRTDFINLENNKTDSTIFSNGQTISNSYTYNSEIFFKHKFSNKKSFLTVSTAYLNNLTTNDRVFSSTTQTNNISSITENYKTDGNQNYKILTSKMDLSFPLLSFTANAGGKLSFINIASNSNFYTIINDNNLLDSSLSNEYIYDENIQSLYFSLKKNMGKWSFKAGLRAEITNTVSNSITNNDTHKNNYLNLFPSIYISHKLNNKNRITFSYTKRIERPPYQYLDPFKWYITKYDYAMGNPFLKPSYINNYELKYLYRNSFSAKIYFTSQNDKIGRYVILDSLNIKNQIQKADNFLNVNTYGLNIYKLLKFRKWIETTLQGDFSYSEFISNKKEFESISGINGTFLMNNTIFLKNKYQLLCNIEENIPGLYNYRTMGNSFQLDIGLNYILNKKGVEIRLLFADVFKTANPEYYYVSGGVKQTYKNYFDTRMFRIMLTWRLGNWFNKTIEKPSSSNTEEKQRL